MVNGILTSCYPSFDSDNCYKYIYVFICDLLFGQGWVGVLKSKILGTEFVIVTKLKCVRNVNFFGRKLPILFL